MITSSELRGMNYNELISIIGETNRPPGGIRTVLDLVKNINITPSTKILEIGTSTGFTAIELSLRTGAQITSIDINEESIKIAKQRAEDHGVAKNIKFLVANAMDLPFENEEFDLVFSGNIISYIPDRKRALSEYIRVLKNNGVLFASPMYYLEEPSELLMEKVRDALKMDIKIDYENYWIEFFSNEQLDLFLKDDFDFDYLPDKEIKRYVKDILKTNKRFIDSRIKNSDTIEDFCSLYETCIYLFRDNLSKMGYSELFFRKNSRGFDRELFTASKRRR